VAERKLALHRVRKLYENGHVKKTDALIAEYYLLEAEQALASSKAEVQRASGK
jgi:outer membrane protein TolC